MRLSAAALEAPGRDWKLGRYELKAELAVGGMGVIYRAYDPLARREVALKRLLVPAGSDRARLTALFQREFGALMRLPHPNIVEVYDYGFDDVGPYYTMELLAGSDLAGSAPLPYQSVCRVLRDVASALALVHTRRLLHRDVSPRNVRLSTDGHAKLIDFGALMSFGKPREVVGTPAFMAPECVSGGALDQRVDLYALGAVAYWLLTGELARAPRSVEEVLWSSGELPAAPSQLVAAIPTELDALVLSLLSEEPLARPSSAAHVIDRLTSIADLPPERDERSVAYSYLRQPPLVARDALVATLEQAVRDACSGQGRTLLIEAAQGLGRSALLDRAEVAAQLAGITVLRVEGVPASPSFSVARRLVELAASAHPALVDRITTLDSMLPASAQVLRSAAEHAKRRASALELAESCLLQLSAQQPLLVLVDDLHTVDAESLALLAALGEHVPDHALSLIATASTAAPTDVHAYATLRKRAERNVPAPLSEAECVKLLSGVFGDVPHGHRLGVWLHAQSGGNPGKCLALLRVLLQRQVIRYTVGTFALPHDVDGDVGSRELSSSLAAPLAETSAMARSLAQALALHDGALTLDQLVGALELPAHDALAELRELTGRAVVRAVVDGFVLGDQALRNDLQRALSDAQARTLHIAIAEALLRDAGGSVDRRLSAALHMLEGGRDEEAEELLTPLTRDWLLLASSATRAIAVLEAMLASYRRRGYPETACLRWLTPMVALSFFGDLETQRRHLDRTLAELSKLCGMTLAARLRPWLGARVALVLGLLYAACCKRLSPSARGLGSLRELLTSLVSIVMSGVAAGSSSFDPESAQRLLTWLEPLSALPRESGAFLIRECCRATAELGAGSFDAAAARYGRILTTLATQQRPLRGFDAAAQRALYFGCLNGQAQAEVANCSPVALELADVLAREASIFFAPHPECTRMSYFAQRGEIDRAESHRLRAEQLALEGGTSWAFVTVLAVRWAYAACQTRDSIRLVRAIAELDRLVATAPNIALIKRVCEAWLEFLRGKVERSIAMFEPLICDETARKLPSRRLDQLMFATVLNAAGKPARAREVCLALEAQGELVTNLRDGQLALADALLGKPNEAAALLDAVLVRAGRNDNPLELGNAHRDRARVALLALDGPAFERHLADMNEQFRRTRNPSLIQQREALLAEAVRCGVRPSPRSGTRPSVPAREEDLDGVTVVEGLPTADD